jgi:hypothetical protein
MIILIMIAKNPNYDNTILITIYNRVCLFMELTNFCKPLKVIFTAYSVNFQSETKGTCVNINHFI